MSSSRLRKLLLPLLRAVKEGRPITFKMRSCAQQGLYLIQKPTKKLDPKLHKKLIDQKKAAASSRASHNQETAAIREEVFRRAGDHCEAGRCHNRASELDHWLSGAGRRRQKQSVENCWALCAPDHLFRTRNQPSAEFWNILFREHCERHGYPVIAHIIHADPAKAGGAP